MSSGRHATTTITLSAELVGAVQEVCTRRRQSLERLGLEALIKIVAKEAGRSLGRGECAHEEITEALAELDVQGKLAIPIPEK